MRLSVYFVVLSQYKTVRVKRRRFGEDILEGKKKRLSEDMLVQYLCVIVSRSCHPAEKKKQKNKIPTFLKTTNLLKHPIGVRQSSDTVCLKAVETVDPQKLPGAS